jgi:hypothetical protein
MIDLIEFKKRIFDIRSIKPGIKSIIPLIEKLYQDISSPVVPEVSQENGGQWIYAGDKLPEKNRVVITFDNKEERDIDKYGCDFVYTDPNGKLHWDWHFDDNDFYWKDFSRFSG